MASTQNLSIYSQQYTFESPRHQVLSLPGPFLQYISQNGAVYEKLIQSCKYFFAWHQIVPIDSVNVAKTHVLLGSVKQLWNYDKVNCHLFKDGMNIDLKNTKLWIYDSVKCYGGSSDFFSWFLKSIHQCTPTSLDFWIHNIIDFNQLSKISNNVKHLEIHCWTTFLFPDKTQATLWDILTLMPKLEKFYSIYAVENSLFLSTKNSTIPVLPNLKEFVFYTLPKEDFPMIAEFIKLHPNTKFDIGIEEEDEEDDEDEEDKGIDVEAFKTMLKETFPNTSITENIVDGWCIFQWTLKSQCVMVEIARY